MVKLFTSILTVIFSFQFTHIQAASERSQKDLVTVARVDIEKYSGLWYEIALIPNRFQKKCKRNTTARYILRDDGKIEVINRCLKEKGEVDEIKGIAKISDSLTNAKLKVSFVRFLGVSLFWADYWIIGLAEDYQWAIVGTPSRKYGWILARKPHLREEILEHIYQKLREQGYDPINFVKTVHEVSDLD